jgi:hypothetical protein
VEVDDGRKGDRDAAGRPSGTSSYPQRCAWQFHPGRTKLRLSSKILPWFMPRRPGNSTSRPTAQRQHPTAVLAYGTAALIYFVLVFITNRLLDRVEICDPDTIQYGWLGAEIEWKKRFSKSKTCVKVW